MDGAFVCSISILYKVSFKTKTDISCHGEQLLLCGLKSYDFVSSSYHVMCAQVILFEIKQ